MAPRPDDPWRSTKRRQVGRTLLDGPLGEAAIVRRLGADKGNTSRLLKGMQKDRLLESEHDRKPRVWRLADGQEQQLARALETEQPVGECRAGQRLILVRLTPGQEVVLAEALRANATTGGVAWAARVEGAEGQYLLVLDRDAPALEASTLGAVLQRHGIASTRMLVEEVQSPDQLRRALSALRAVPHASM